MKYTINTCGETWSVTAKDMDSAVRKAFRARLPKGIGLLVEITPEGEESSFTLGRRALEIAGLRVEE
jgi:ribosomal protein S12